MTITNSYPQVVYDIDQTFGNDINFTALTGKGSDLNTVSGAERSVQRILRRLLTNPGDYIWHPNYGAGLKLFIGQPLDADLFSRMKGLIISQIFLEDSVSKTPTPEIFLKQIEIGIFCQIKYTLNPTQEEIVLPFNIT